MRKRKTQKPNKIDETQRTKNPALIKMERRFPKPVPGRDTFGLAHYARQESEHAS